MTDIRLSLTETQVARLVEMVDNAAAVFGEMNDDFGQEYTDVAAMVRAALALARVPRGRGYVLNGEPLDFAEFAEANMDFDEADWRAIAGLDIGGEIVYGGGAAPVSILRRVA